MEIKGIDVKNHLKEQGYETKKISVRVTYSGYGSISIKITLKDLKLNRAELDNVVSKKYKNIRYDEHVQGEILEGCNTFVNCEYDYDLLEAAINKQLPKAKKIYSNLQMNASNLGTIIFENETIKATAFYKDEIVYISSKSGERNKRIGHYLTSEYDLACIFERLETIGTL